MAVTRRSNAAQPAELPDELWALVLSKCTWKGAKKQVHTLLLWRPGAAAALQSRPDLVASLLNGQAQTSLPLFRAACSGAAAVVRRLLQLTYARYTAHDIHVTLQYPGSRTISETQLAAMIAAVNGHIATAEQLALLVGGADGAQLCHMMLVYAARWGQVSIGQLMLQQPAIKDQQCISLLTNSSPDAVYDTATLGSVSGVFSLMVQIAIAALSGSDSLLLQLYGRCSDAEARTDALQAAAACHRLTAVQRMLLGGVSVQQLEGLLCLTPVRSSPQMVEVLMDGAAVRTRAVRRRLMAVVADAVQKKKPSSWQKPSR